MNLTIQSLRLARFARPRLLMLLLALAGLGLWDQAHAAVIYNFTFSDSAGDAAYGQLTANPNGNGTYTVVSGFFQGTAGSILGNYPLYPNPNAPSTYATSPAGAFWYDNQLFPSTDPRLDTYGLLFTAGTIEINLWGGDQSGNLTPGVYSLYEHDSSVGGYSIAFTGSATFSVTPVPEANTLIALAFLLLPIFAGRALLGARAGRSDRMPEKG